MDSSSAEVAGRPGVDANTGTIGSEGVIDADHLERITLGDQGLEREVLQIFVRQAAIMIGRIAGPDLEIAVVAAHSLKGSAAGIGAWRVARAAERAERASLDGRRETLDAAITDLKAASLEASAAIAARLAAKAS